MKKIFILHANNANRGDEAAIHAMIDELSLLYDDVKIVISINGSTLYPNLPENVEVIPRFPALGSKYSMVEFMLCMKTKGKLCFSKQAKYFIKCIQEADVILHAPGGPSIGDIYKRTEFLSLQRLNLVRKLGKKYIFYAPSMGPFKNEKRNLLRKSVINGAAKVVVRDPISQEYVKNLVEGKKIELALDSSLQHDIDLQINEKKLNEYKDLKKFLEKHKRCIGVTITDLLWHPSYRDDLHVSKNIRKVFKDFLNYLSSSGVGIVFVPQLYGTGNDSILMSSFAENKENYFVVEDNDERYDSYFQQYIIKRLYAVIGMRYHSNIFSAKMGIPFVSISYEQKMSGFMSMMELDQYCISLKDLNYDLLKKKYIAMLENYDEYQKKLRDAHCFMKEEAYKTTVIVKEVLEEK